MAMSKRIGIWLKASPPLAVLWLSGPGRLVFSTGLSGGQKGLWWDPQWVLPWEGRGSWPPSPSASGLHFCVWKRGMHKVRVQNWMKFSSPIPLISCLLIVSRNKSHWDVYSLPVRVCSPEIVPGPFFSASVMLGSQETPFLKERCVRPGSTRGWGEAWSQNTNQLLTNLENQGHECLVLWTLLQGPPYCLLIEENRLLSPQASVLSKLLHNSLWPLDKGCGATEGCVLWRDRHKEGKVPFLSGPSLVLRSDPLWQMPPFPHFMPFHHLISSPVQSHF